MPNFAAKPVTTICTGFSVSILYAINIFGLPRFDISSFIMASRANPAMLRDALFTFFYRNTR